MNRRLVLGVLGIAIAIAIVVGYALVRERVARASSGLLAEAREAQAAGEIDTAIAAYQQYLASAGHRRDDGPVMVDYANLLLDRMAAPGAARRFAGDLPAVETAVMRNPGDTGLRLRLARAFMTIRRFVDARVHLLAARQAIGAETLTVAGEPFDRDAIDLLIATAWAGSGPPERAAEFIGERIGFSLDTGRFTDSSAAAPPRDQAALFVMLEGLLRDRLRQPEAADVVLERCVVRHPDDLAAWMRYGERMAARKEVAKAVDAFSRARRLAPADDPRGILAEVQMKTLEDKRSEAVALLGEARRRFPRRDEVLEAAMRCADRWRDGDLALSVLDECVEWYGPRPILITMLSGIRIDPRDVDAVQSRLEALRTQAGPGNVAIPMLEARLLMARGHWFAAKRLLESLRPEVTANAEAKRRIDLHLATCSWNLGDYDEQLAAYRRMGALYSDRAAWTAARLEAASALAASGQQADAILEVRAIDGAFKSLPPDQLRDLLRRSDEPLRLRIDLVKTMPERQRYWGPIDALVQAMADDPECSPARLAVAKARLLNGQGRLDVALAVVNAAIRKAPDDAALRAAQIDLVLRIEGPPAARKLAAKAPEAVRGDPEFLLAEARAVATGAIDDNGLAPIAARAEAIPEPAEAARVLRELAALAVDADRGGDARDFLRRATARLPDDSRAPLALLESSWRDGEVEAARLAAAAIHGLHVPAGPEHRLADAGILVAEVRAGRGRPGTDSFKGLLQPDKERLRKARLLLSEAESVRPGWPLMNRLLCEIELFEGNPKGAIDRLLLARQFDADKRSATRRLVALCHAEERFAEAQAELESLGPGDLHGIERIAVDLLLRKDRIDDAVAIAGHLVPDDSGNADDLLWLGDLLARAGRSSEATAVVDRAAGLAPLRLDAWLSLMARHLADGRRDLAEQSLARGGDAIEGRQRSRLLARGTELLGRSAEAERHFRQAVDDAPTDIGAAGDAVEFYVRQGRVDEARELLGRMVDSPGTEAADLDAQFWARRRLAQLNRKARPAASAR